MHVSAPASPLQANRPTIAQDEAGHSTLPIDSGSECVAANTTATDTGDQAAIETDEGHGATANQAASPEHGTTMNQAATPAAPIQTPVVTAPGADAATPPTEPTPTTVEAARCLTKFTAEVQRKRQSPLIAAPPKQRDPPKRPIIPLRSRRIAWITSQHPNGGRYS